MEQAKGIRYTRQALHDLDKIEQYITEQGYPSTAISYISRIMGYIKTLNQMPERNALCKSPVFAKKGFYCAIFENTYIIVYAIAKQTIDVKRIIHGMRLNY